MERFCGNSLFLQEHDMINVRLPLDTGRKLNAHKTFRRRPRRLLNVLMYVQFNLCPVSIRLWVLNTPQNWYINFWARINFWVCFYKFSRKRISVILVDKTNEVKIWPVLGFDISNAFFFDWFNFYLFLTLFEKNFSSKILNILFKCDNAFKSCYNKF